MSITKNLVALALAGVFAVSSSAFATDAATNPTTDNTTANKKVVAAATKDAKQDAKLGAEKSAEDKNKMIVDEKTGEVKTPEELKAEAGAMPAAPAAAGKADPKAPAKK
jgi:type IV secretory pathway VirB6-like protein